MLMPLAIVAFVTAGIALGCEHDHHVVNVTTGASRQGRSLAWQISGGCGSPRPTDEELHRMNDIVAKWDARNHGLATTKETFTIKVWWHVMKAGNTPRKGAWSKKQARNAISKVNAHLKKQEAPFVLTLEGVTQTTNAKWFNCINDYELEQEFKTNLRVEGRADTLNIYMCDLYHAQNYFGLAYYPTVVTYYPELDGITLANPFTGGFVELDTQMALIHELGHWLGLMHTFENTNSRCRGAGDAVKDTAAHFEPSVNYAGWATCFQGMKLNTCPDKRKGIDSGLDPVNNYMNYIATWCREQYGDFTKGQITRMTSLFEEYRFNKTTCRRSSVGCLEDSHCCSESCIRKKCL